MSLLYRALAPAGKRSRLSVLIFHRVLPEPDPLRPSEPTAAEFEQRLRWIKAHFNVIPLTEAIAGLRSGSLPERPLSITFDDGYADNHDLALPVLKKLGLTATFFVAAGFLDGGRMFNDTVIEAIRRARVRTLDLADLGLGEHSLDSVASRHAAIAILLDSLKYLVPKERSQRVEDLVSRSKAVALPDDMMMTSVQVAALHRGGMTVGAHTYTHPILAEIPLDAARQEIERGRARLEDITGARVTLFAYPNGRPQQDYRCEHVDLVRSLGFDAAVSTAWGAARPGDDVYQIPRFTPWDGSHWRFGMRLMRNLARWRYEVVERDSGSEYPAARSERHQAI